MSTSVTAWMEAPYFTSSSMTLMRFFLQAMCRGVKPFCAKDNRVSRYMHTTVTLPHAGTLPHLAGPSRLLLLQRAPGSPACVESCCVLTEKTSAHHGTGLRVREGTGAVGPEGPAAQRCARSF